MNLGLLYVNALAAQQPMLFLPASLLRTSLRIASAAFPNHVHRRPIKDGLDKNIYSRCVLCGTIIRFPACASSRCSAEMHLVPAAGFGLSLCHRAAGDTKMAVEFTRPAKELAQ